MTRKKKLNPIGIDQNTGRVRFRISGKNPVLIYGWTKVKVSGKIRPQFKLTKRQFKKLMKKIAKKERKYDNNW